MFEIALALAILALCIVPLATLLTTETRQTRLSRNRMFAAHLANAVVERLRMESIREVGAVLPTWEAGSAWIASDPLLTPSTAPEAYRQMLSGFRRFACFEPDPSGGALSGRKGTLRVRIEWDEAGQAREMVTGVVLVNADFPGGRP